jgi:hypothetical protein
MPESNREKMNQDAKRHAAPKESNESVDLRDDGESRFRAAVHAAAKSGPMHRTPKS